MAGAGNREPELTSSATDTKQRRGGEKGMMGENRKLPALKASPPSPQGGVSSSKATPPNLFKHAVHDHILNIHEAPRSGKGI